MLDSPPPPPALPAPRGLKTIRQGSTVTVRWEAIAGAAGYTLSVRLSNGVEQHYALGIRGAGKDRQLRLSIPGYLGARVTSPLRPPGRDTARGAPPP
jgi:hypothetical protein